MKSQIKIFLKIIIIIGLITHLPYQTIYSEKIQNVITTPKKLETTQQTNGKSIYIYNTHQSEKYQTKSVKEGSRYLMNLLKEKGYTVNYETKDFELYKTKNNIDYTKSYTVSKKYLNIALKNHGTYDLVIDFHRDSIKKSAATLQYKNKSYAKLMFVVGKGSSNYKKVKKLSLQLSSMLNSKIPNISKGIYEKVRDYNQGTTSNMVLIEVGSNTNTYQEIQNSINILVLAIDSYLSK